jgi:hypothetical protein
VDAYVPPHRRPKLPEVPEDPTICKTCKSKLEREDDKTFLMPLVDLNYYKERFRKNPNQPMRLANADWQFYTDRYSLVHSGRFTSESLEGEFPGYFTQHELEEAQVAYDRAHPYTCFSCKYEDLDLFD